MSSMLKMMMNLGITNKSIMNTSNKPEDRENTYLLLYTKISKVTAEINGKKQIYNGQIKELFSGVDVSKLTITKFLWAISHKTDALPTNLFSIKKTGNGVAIERLHSGFYDNSGKHIVGADLVPFIMRAMPLYQPKENKVRASKHKPEIVEAQKQEEEVKIVSQEESPKVPLFDCIGKLDLSSYKDEDLPALQEAIAKAFADEQLRREEARKEAERHAKIQQTLAVIKEMLSSEGITWDDILKEDGIL